ncbi:MAG: 30S ribosomal protein S24e [Candidatus Diapherotrites archaeon]|nr:30S ribosomal protein S24e [Candidatus Diapherotrites archaeon]
MELEILERNKNPLLQREEIIFKTFSEKTPSRKEIKSKLAALLDKEENLIIIDKIENKFGSKEIEGFAKVYNSKEYLKVETKKNLRKNLGIEDKSKKESDNKG